MWDLSVKDRQLVQGGEIRTVDLPKIIECHKTAGTNTDGALLMIRFLSMIAVAALLLGCQSTTSGSNAQAPATRTATAPAGSELAQINALRRNAGVGDLSRSAALQRAAEAHLADMVRNGFFSHSGSNGSSVGQRVRQQGYDYRRVAENIAMGDRTVSAVLDRWMGSSGHRRNLLDRRLTQYGLAQSGDTWVMVIGAPG